MNGVLSRLVCVIALNLLASTADAAWMSSSMSWSPDSRWLCYTVSADPVDVALRPGWLFDPAPAARDAGVAPSATRKDLASSAVYRIWAANQNGQSTVLIEESRWPLSAPAWSPRGRSVAFGRFVPQSRELKGGSVPGRLEIVVQRGLDQKEVVWTSPEFVLDEATRAAIPYHHCSWSPDGQFLAIPRPGREPAVDLISTDTKKRLHILDHAILPVWSPDGSMCAYIRRGFAGNSLEIVKRRGRSFSEARELLATGPVTAAPFWSADGQSILVVTERTTSRSRELELARCPLGSGEPSHVLNLVPDPLRRVARIRGITIDYDKEADVSFHALDLENRDSELVASNLRDPQTHKRFHPVDPSLPIGAVSVSPDGHCVAARFGDPDALSHPTLYSTETEATTLLVPDETSRQEWLRMLTATAVRLLRGGLPPIVVDGHATERPTLLPLPGEFAALGNVGARLGRIAELGSSLLPARDPRSRGVRPEVFSPDTEARLLFNYLRGEFREAAADLGVLDLETTDPENRLSLLGLRAQIVWAQGDQEAARRIIAYLVSNAGTATVQLEDTPLGPVVTKVASPLQAWSGFLSLRAAQAQAQAPEPQVEEIGDPFDAQGGALRRRLLEIPELPPFEPGAGGPFAPLPAPDLDRPVRPN